MTDAHLDAMTSAIAQAVGERMQRALAPIKERLVALEAEVATLKQKRKRYHGVWQRALADDYYQRDDEVTHKGALWIAVVEQPTGAPGESSDWQLARKGVA